MSAVKRGEEEFLIGSHSGTERNLGDAPARDMNSPGICHHINLKSRRQAQLAGEGQIDLIGLGSGVEKEAVGAVSIEENPIDHRYTRYGVEPDRSIGNLR